MKEGKEEAGKWMRRDKKEGQLGKGDKIVDEKIEEIIEMLGPQKETSIEITE